VPKDIIEITNTSRQALPVLHEGDYIGLRVVNLKCTGAVECVMTAFHSDDYKCDCGDGVDLWGHKETCPERSDSQSLTKTMQAMGCCTPDPAKPVDLTLRMDIDDNDFPEICDYCGAKRGAPGVKCWGDNIGG